MAKVMTLEQLLSNTEDDVLLDIQEELISGIVPATGAAHGFVRKVNRMIDQGKLCINPSTYRKVYLPTLAKAVQKEMAHRYTMFLKGQITSMMGESLVAATKETSCEQTALNLVEKNEQVNMEEER